MSPEEMVAEGDPIALEIYAENDEVLMPNLQLNSIEVAALIDYMDAETRRLTLPVTKPVHGHAGHHEGRTGNPTHSHH